MKVIIAGGGRAGLSGAAHLSNGGQTNPNPGLDSLGFTLGVSRSF